MFPVRSVHGRARRGRRPGRAIGVALALVAGAVTAAGGGVAAAAVTTPYPYSGQFSHVFDTGNIGGQNKYINDHTLIKDRQGTWHLFGIQGVTAPAGQAPNSEAERSLMHATAPGLGGPWTVQADALTAISGESHLWAPHVVEACPSGSAMVPCSQAANSTYFMFYAAGRDDRVAGSDPSTAAIDLATTTDLRQPFVRAGAGGQSQVLFRDGWEARDPMVTWTGSQWVMYYTATVNASLAGTDGAKNIVAYRTSSDLRNWSARGIAFQDSRSTAARYGGVNSQQVVESPFVIQHDGYWYLFIGPRSNGYRGTDAYRSTNPVNFNNKEWMGSINAHAAEIVTDGSNTYVTNAGWFQQGLDIAGVGWAAGPLPFQSAQNPAVGRNADGRLEVFAIGPNGSEIDNLWQRTDGSWSNWNEGSSGPFGPGSAGAAPTVVRNADGRLEVFALGPNGGNIANRWQTQPNCCWSQWDGNFGPTAAGSAPVGALNQDGRMELFALSPGGRTIVHKWQQQAGSNWSGWEKIGDAAGSIPAIANGGGRLTAVVLGPGSQNIAAITQTAPNSAFGAWNGDFGPTPAGGPPVLVQSPDGTLDLFVVNPYGNGISHRYQRPGQAWSAWDAQFADGAAGTFVQSVSAVVTGNGTIDVFASGPGRGVNAFIKHKQMRNAQWGNWTVSSRAVGSCAPSPAFGKLNVVSALLLRDNGTAIDYSPNGDTGWSQLGGAGGGAGCNTVGLP